MHERTERAVARLLFVFCCAVPTSFVFLAILISWTPWHQSRQLSKIEYLLGRETGLVFQIEECRHTAPGAYELNQVQLSDPDSGRLVATIRSIEYYRDHEKAGIELHHPEFQSAGLGVAWSALHDRLIGNPQHTMVPIRIAASRLNIISSTGSLPLQDLYATVDPEPNGVRMHAQASDASLNSETMLSVDLFRDRDVKYNGRSALPETEVVISTEQTAFPCTVLSEYMPQVKTLGQDAIFRGMIKCRQTPEGWRFDFGGATLSQVNLANFSEQLPHPLRGTANIALTTGTVLPGESVSLTGVVQSDNVWMMPDLLLSMQTSLGLSIQSPTPVPPNQFLELQLSAHFDLQDSSLRLTGNCDATQIGIAMQSRSGLVVRTLDDSVPSDRVLAAVNPSRRSIGSWSQIFLPSPVTSPGTAPVRIGALDAPSGGPTTYEPESDRF